MVKIIMHGCNGKMGQVISGLIAADPDMELVAESMPETMDNNPYPVFTDIYKCDVAADAIIDFSAAVAVDKLLITAWRKASLRAVYHWSVRGTAGESRRSSEKGGYLKIRQYVPGYQPDVKTVKRSCRSAGQRRLRYGDCGEAPNLKVDAPAAPHWHWQIPSTRNLTVSMNMSMTAATAESRDRRKKLASALSEAAPSSVTMM